MPAATTAPSITHLDLSSGRKARGAAGRTLRTSVSPVSCAACQQFLTNSFRCDTCNFKVGRIPSPRSSPPSETYQLPQCMGGEGAICGTAGTRSTRQSFRCRGGSCGHPCTPYGFTPRPYARWGQHKTHQPARPAGAACGLPMRACRLGACRMPRAALVSRRGVPWQVRHRPPPPAARRGMRDGPTSRVSRARATRWSSSRSTCPSTLEAPVTVLQHRGSLFHYWHCVFAWCPAWRLKGGGGTGRHVRPVNIGQTYLLDLVCHETRP